MVNMTSGRSKATFSTVPGVTLRSGTSLAAHSSFSLMCSADGRGLIALDLLAETRAKFLEDPPTNKELDERNLKVSSYSDIPGPKFCAVFPHRLLGVLRSRLNGDF